ncbi:peptidase domain-containing ABC transporter [Salmonella enterica subsp. enterica]|nr:peptidase domain-containing ABC transporter [Salmonella enterica subsp. enterica]EED3334873.1 peptidase domain-containing ABC transporter [Salmonella enterica subsp. enterica]
MNFFGQLNLNFNKKLPLILQTESTECGLACIAMIAGYFGHHISLVKMREKFPISLKGINLRGIIKIANEMGLGTRAIRTDLSGLNKLKLPCILHWGFTHFVILKKITNNYVEIYDPARGITKADKSELSQQFTGVALELWPKSDFTTKKKTSDIKLRKLLGPIRGLSFSLSMIIALSFCIEIFTLLQPLLQQWILDEVIVSNDVELLRVIIVGLTIVVFINQITIALRSWLLTYFSTQLNVQWRINVFTHLLSLPIQYFERRYLGDITSRFSSIDNIQKVITTSLISGIIDGIVSIVTLSMMLFYSLKLTLIAIVTMGLYLILRALIFPPLKKCTEESIIKEARQQSHFLESIRGIKTIKLFNQQTNRRDNWISLFISQVNAGINIQKKQILYQQINGVLFGLENIFIIWIGSGMVLNGVFTVGAFIAFNAFKLNFNSRINSFIDNYFELKIMKVQSSRLSDIVCSTTEKYHSKYSYTNIDETTQCSIRFENISFSYSSMENPVFSNVTFTIEEHESVALIGASGCGKTTLINVLFGILKPTSGDIYISGKKLSNLDIENVRDIFGTVLQDDVLFAGTIYQNIVFFSYKPDRLWAEKCAMLAGIHDDIIDMPMGYFTLVGDMGTTLSGGQKQRILLARALYKKPKILILDEATSHLDIKNEKLVTESLKSMRITKLFVAHRPETIMTADKIIILDKFGTYQTTPEEYNPNSTLI